MNHRTKKLIIDLNNLDGLNVRDNMPTVKPIPLPSKDYEGWKSFMNYLVLLKTRQWRLNDDYILPIGDVGLYIPKPFEFDFASIPRIFWPILSPTDILLVSSCFHDFGYRYGGLLFVTKTEGIVFVKMTKSELDEIFKLITVKINGLAPVAATAKGMVSCFGYFAWNNNRKLKLDVIKDYSFIDIRIG